MGEYATRRSDGAEIKIGTCEDMYYLRANQRFSVAPLEGNTDPGSDEAYGLRFRFPWPDEDGTSPGAFESYDRALPVYGYAKPANLNHYSVQFVAQAGYNVCLPCPESLATPDGAIQWNGATIHRNGFRGSVLLSAQKLLRDGRLVPVLRCGGCGTMWRLEDRAEIEALAVALRAEGDKHPNDARNYHEVADRVLRDAMLGLTLVSV